MEIGLVTYSYQTSYSVTSLKKKEDFSVDEKDIVFSDELSLYQDICKDYPNVSFRMDDYQSQGNEITADFSFHETKKGFSNPGVPSITIDKNLLTKALKDKRFEEDLRGNIKTIVYNYNNLTKRDPEDPPYCAIDLTYDNGEMQTGVTWANEQFSTDEQLKKMWHVTDIMDNNGFLKLIRQIQQETTDQLFQMQSNHPLKIKKTQADRSM